MLIHKIQLQNITVHKNTTIEFTSGVNVLAGANGSGKSTVLRMMGYCLFGSLPDTKESYIRNTVDVDGPSLVKIWFLGNDNIEYVLERSLGKSNIKLSRVGEDLPFLTRANDLNSFFQQQFQIENGLSLENIFNSAIGVPQGTFISPFLERPIDRKNYFDPILNVEIYKKIWDFYREVEKQFDKEIEKLKNQIAELAGMTERIIPLSQQIAAMNETVSDLQAQLDSITIETQDAKNEYKKLEALRKLVESLSNEIEKTNLLIDTNDKNQKKLEIDLETANKSIQICDSNKEGYEEYLNLMEQQKNLQDKQSRLQEFKDLAIDSQRSLNDQFSSIFEEIFKIHNQQLQAANSQKTQISTEIDQYKTFAKKSEEYICPFLNEPCQNIGSSSLKDRFLEEIAHRQDLFEQISQQVDAYTNQNESIQQDKKKILDLLKTQDRDFELKDLLNHLIAFLDKKTQKKFSNQFSLLIQNYDKWNEIQLKINEMALVPTECAQTNKEIGRVKKAYDQYQLNISATEKKTELESQLGQLQREATTLQETLRDQQEQRELQAQEFTPQKLEKAETKYQNKSNELQDLRTKIGEKSNQLFEKEQDLANLQVKEKEKEQMERLKDLIANASVFNTMLRSWIKEAGPKIITVYIHQISEFASNIYSQLMGFDMVKLTWKEDYDVVLVTPQNTKKFTQLSGGEQMAVALSIRMAIIKIFSGIDFAFFDEPTTNLDKEKRSNLAQSLQNLRGFNQLFVISHDDTFEQSADIVHKLVKNASEESSLDSNI